ncbi:4-hydroxyphenylacetate 3-monooxygenase, reductase component-like [Ylistrum balloti]|uniref:4-hydroxyphenylacetate 3-monooxygenase, reductase component-like n=1 Tax=Ylistrum balloti TaxID=509963 RepID=UPI002905A3D1|nr:4-hydroxyphenylacetate 3-monooxygenase, reductase component-like [Ylistrum balloti]
MASIQDAFKQALASWASGVTVVSTKLDGNMYGLTASSFSSLSLEPPLVLVCLASTNRLPSMIKESQQFAVSILAHGQEEISNSFARPGREPTPDFDGYAGKLTTNDQPIIPDCAAYLACDVHDLIIQGDHCIAIGRVIEAAADDTQQPLIYYRRAYHTVGNS